MSHVLTALLLAIGFCTGVLVHLVLTKFERRSRQFSIAAYADLLEQHHAMREGLPDNHRWWDDGQRCTCTCGVRDTTGPQ